MQEVIVNLNIPAQEYLKFYQGLADNIIAKAEDGRTVQLPASALKRFLTHSGIAGRFKITFDSHGKLKSIKHLT